MDFYNNPRIVNVRIIQCVIAGAAAFVSGMMLTEGEAAIALVFGVIGAVFLVAFDRYYLRLYVTRLRQESSGWVLTTLTTFGERRVAFDARDATLGGEIVQNVRYGALNYHYPLYVSGKRFILDTTPPAQADIEALQRAFGG